jgi:hypothetical protein
MTQLTFTEALCQALLGVVGNVNMRWGEVPSGGTAHFGLRPHTEKRDKRVTI